MAFCLAADRPGVLAGDDVLATAALARLLHRCHALNIGARSGSDRREKPKTGRSGASASGAAG